MKQKMRDAAYNRPLITSKQLRIFPARAIVYSGRLAKITESEMAVCRDWRLVGTTNRNLPLSAII